MPTRPDTKVTTNPRPRMVIFEDQPAMLGRFVKNFQDQGFDVIPVLVSQPSNDKFFADGRVDQTALSAHIEKLRKDPQAWSSVMNYEALQHFEYGVKNRGELRALLRELAPDVVLSDERMRLDRKNIADEATMREDENVIRGTDVMRMSAELLPTVPRAIHTAIYDAVFEPVPEAKKIEARSNGYMIFAKDDYEAKAQPQAGMVARYFRKELERAQKPSIER